MRRPLNILLLLFGALLAGCGANSYMVKEVPYAAPSPPGPNQTLVYVFREDSFQGGGRKFAIVDNDTVMAVLTPGTFSYFVVPSGEHEIVALMTPTPIMHYRVTAAPGKTVYLFCKMGYASGTFIEPIDESQAKSLLGQYRYTEIGVKGEKVKDFRAYYDKLYR